MEDKILGTLYGQAIGDAMGMPSELWPRQHVKAYFGEITEFLDGPGSNRIAKYFRYGQYTDDTAQALVILDALIANDFQPDQKLIAEKLIKWAHQMNAFENEILGPSSKAALKAISQQKNPKPITDKAETNGSAMRIAPIGTLFHPTDLEALVDYVYQVTTVTHSSDIAIAGAAAIAASVSAAVYDYSWEEIIEFAFQAHDLGLERGAATYTASIKERTKIALHLAQQYPDDQEQFLESIYQVIGSGVALSESVPAALSIAYYSQNVEKCALLCANLGGDTDTIGAMATAICGAKAGYQHIPKLLTDVIQKQNKVDLSYYSSQMFAYLNSQSVG